MATGTVKWFNDAKGFGFITQSGRVTVPFIYDWAWSFSDGLAAVFLNEKAGYIDTAGNIIVPLLYDDAHPFREGLAIVSLINDLDHE